MAIQKEVKVLISAVDDYSGGMMGFNSAALTIITTVGALATAMIVASTAAAGLSLKIGKDVVDSAADFHDAIFDVTAVAQSFGTSSGQISDILDDLTAKFPVTGAQAGDALQLIAQLGYGARDELEAMANAANTLKLATGADLQTSVQGSLAAMNAWGMEAGEAMRVTNLFAAASFTSAATVGDLTTALRYAAPVASMAGISVEETVAALAKLKDRGLEASQAGTTLRMGLTQLFKETDKGREALAKYGLTYGDVNPEVNTLAGIIGKFKGQVVSASDSVSIFGVRAAVMGTIVNEGRTSFENYTESITGTSAAVDAMEQKLKKWSVVQEQITGNLDLFKKTIAADLVPELVNFVGTREDEGLRGVIKYLTELEEMEGGLSGAFVDTFEGMKDALSGFFEDSFGDLDSFYEWLVLIAQTAGKNITIVTEWLSLWGGLGVTATDSLSAMQTLLTVINGSFLVMTLAVTGIHDAYAVTANMVKVVIAGIQVVFWGVIGGITEGMLRITELLDKLPGADLSDDIKNLSASVKEFQKNQDDAFDVDIIETWSGGAIDRFNKVQDGIGKLGETSDKVATTLPEAIGLSADEVARLADNASVASGEIKEFDSYAQLVGKNLVLVNGKLVEATEETRAAVKETKNLKSTTEGVVESVEKGARKWTQYTTITEEANEKVLDLDKAVEKMSDREFSLYSEKFKSDLELVAQESKQAADIIKNNIEWTAKLEIEEAKLNAEILKAAFESVAQSVSATAEASSDMFGSLANFKGQMGARWKLERTLERQMDLQEAALEVQKELVKSTVELNKAKKERIENLSEDAMIKVQGDGLKPHLEAMMWEVFEAIQIRATEEGLDKLLLGADLSS